MAQRLGVAVLLLADWVTANRVRPAVANMSLGGGASSALDAAINNSIAAGVMYVVAAGNSNADACGSSPARVPAALTAGATTSTDARSSFSNFGTCLNVFAPGSSITSAWNTSNTAASTISGTSMASPHVAGAAALYLQTNPGAAAATVAQAVVAQATAGVVGSPGTGSPNRLLYTRFPAGGPPDLTSAPWAFSGNAWLSTAGYQHGGTRYAAFGNSNNASGSLYQTVAIPVSATETLTFWLNVTSSETTTTTVHDRLYVEVRSTSGALLATPATFSNLNKAAPRVYTQRSVGLAAWKGQTVRVQFRVTTDGLLATSFRVDDVSLR